MNQNSLFVSSGILFDGAGEKGAGAGGGGLGGVGGIVEGLLGIQLPFHAHSRPDPHSHE